MPVIVKNTKPSVPATLLLDFAKSKSLDKRITFERTSRGTYFDEYGVIQTAQAHIPRFDHNPNTRDSKGLLVEEQSTNSFTESNNFTSWTSAYGGVIEPNAALGPDNKFSASKYTTATDSIAYKSVGGLGTGNYVTFSIFLKKGTQDWVLVRVSRSSGTTYGEFGMHFNLNTGVKGTAANPGTGELYDSSIVAVGNGWYRCSVTGRVPDATSYGSYFVPVASDGGSSSALNTIFCYGAQLETGYFSSSYAPSVDSFSSRSSIATYFDENGKMKMSGANIARYGYKWDSSVSLWKETGLIVEPQRTNLVTSSEHISSSTNLLQNLSVSPFGGATTPFETKACRVTLTAGGGEKHVRFAIASRDNSTEYTFSIYIKLVSGLAGIQIWDPNSVSTATDFNLTTLTATNRGSITDAGNGWYRLSAVNTTTATSTSIYVFFATTPNTYSFTASGSEQMDIWAPQYEILSFASSYIPTAGSTTTRISDSVSSSAATRTKDYVSIYDFKAKGLDSTKKEYTWSVTYDVLGRGTGYSSVIEAENTNNSNYYALRHDFVASANMTRYIVTTNGDLNLGANDNETVPINTKLKVSAAFKVNDVAYKRDNLVLRTDTAVTFSDVNRVRIMRNGNDNVISGHLYKIVYYNTRVTNAELEELNR